MGMYRFVKIIPEKNQHRWYVVTWGPTLFGSWAVTRAWGRLGSAWSQRRIEEYGTQDAARAEAQVQVERRKKRGYVHSN